MTKQYEARQVSPNRWIWELRNSDGKLIAMTTEIFRSYEAVVDGVKDFKDTVNAKRIINMDSDYQVNKRGGAKKSIKAKPA